MGLTIKKTIDGNKLTMKLNGKFDAIGAKDLSCRMRTQGYWG